MEYFTQRETLKIRDLYAGMTDWQMETPITGHSIVESPLHYDII